MRKRLTGALVLTLVLVALLVPMAHLLSTGQGQADANDADHMVKPMLALLAQSPAAQANTPVETLMELEDAWAIEDTREESDVPLITGMRREADELGYDSESDTFYCTLGMDGGDDWPELALYAQGAEDVRVAWIDDYTYDYRSDAIREGYRYELMAYTDTQYAYFGVVFTGLPIVTLEVEEGTEIGDAYVPSRVSIADFGGDAINAGAWVHLRGGGYDKGIDKLSYRVEFHELSGGKDQKSSLSVLGMEADTDWLLISNASDETGMRNHMCWDLWQKWNPDGDAPVLLESRMVEVFVNDEYKGLYQVMQRIKVKEEIARLGGNVETDYVYRIVRDFGVESRPAQLMDSRWYELRSKPAHVSEARQFDRIENYVTMNMKTDDETFAAIVEECIDMDALMNYYAFSQAADLGYENVDNNVYIWAIHQEDGRYLYYLSPWDMDNALPAGQGTPEEVAGLNLMMRMPFQILNLDLMNSRQIYADIWAQKRETLLTEDGIYQWFDEWETYINDSGAYLRESEKWWGGARELNLGEICANMVSSMGNMDRQMRELWPTQEQAESLLSSEEWQ